MLLNHIDIIKIKSYIYIVSNVLLLAIGIYVSGGYIVLIAKIRSQAFKKGVILSTCSFRSM